MIEFKPIEIKDKQWIDPLLAAADMRGCHQNFTNLFAWAKIYNYRVAKVKTFLVVMGELAQQGPYYFYPAGQGNIEEILKMMRQDAMERGHDVIFAGLSPDNIAQLDDLFPERFVYKESRDSFDYIYLLEKLVSLAGRKLQSKRNHINRFKANHNWSFEEISADNIDECWEMNIEWCKAHGCEDDEHLTNEDCAVRRCFNHYQELELEGGLLRAGGKVIAYTFGDKLNSDTYDIHVEKAFSEIQGAYQMINREFAAVIQARYPQLIYFNREEDMGYAGIRKAKLSYRPVAMEEKYWGNYIAK
ncbi:MAG: phosphatidylglycerol lysyltransferase domain-containing protein [Firmicutes bacterium]|nr:phosphatidylglycerol lysyltransferase domain-containing protein [Bacillota bacterium]